MLPWLCNVQLVDISSTKTSATIADWSDKDINTMDPMRHVEMSGDGWGSSKATQLVLNNLFYLTVKVRSPHYTFSSGVVYYTFCTKS